MKSCAEADRARNGGSGSRGAHGSRRAERQADRARNGNGGSRRTAHRREALSTKVAELEAAAADADELRTAREELRAKVAELEAAAPKRMNCARLAKS